MAWVSLTSFEDHMSIFGISADTAVIIPGNLALAMGLELLPLLVPLGKLLAQADYTPYRTQS